MSAVSIRRDRLAKSPVSCALHSRSAPLSEVIPVFSATREKATMHSRTFFVLAALVGAACGQCGQHLACVPQTQPILLPPYPPAPTTPSNLPVDGQTTAHPQPVPPGAQVRAGIGGRGAATPADDSGNLTLEQYESILRFFTENLKARPAASEGSRKAVDSFHQKLFRVLSSKNAHRNIVFSPISLQVLLSFVFSIARGQTAEELRQVLDVPANLSQHSLSFAEVLRSQRDTNTTALIVANKLYYDGRLGAVSPAVKSLAKSSYDTEVEPANFAFATLAAATMNQWVASRTHGLIQNIVSPHALRADTSAVLVDAIYFKAMWMEKFSTHDTQQHVFRVNRQRQVLVDMMYNEDIFLFGEFADLQASVLEMAYEATDITMMLLLPHEVDGLADLEGRLAQHSLKDIGRQLKPEEITVRVPKFRIEFEADMVRPLQELGVRSLFGGEAQVTVFSDPSRSLRVSAVQHKAFIDVNEAGTEAAASSFVKFVPLSLPARVKSFTADHPFVFVVRSPETVYFMGHVVDF